jgi:hypothetical protein
MPTIFTNTQQHIYDLLSSGDFWIIVTLILIGLFGLLWFIEDLIQRRSNPKKAVKKYVKKSFKKSEKKSAKKAIKKSVKKSR